MTYFKALRTLLAAPDLPADLRREIEHAAYDCLSQQVEFASVPVEPPRLLASWLDEALSLRRQARSKPRRKSSPHPAH